MHPKKIEELTSDQFMDRIIMKKADALVKVSTSWNGASQLLCHSLQRMAPLYSGRVDFFSLDYETESALSSTYRVDRVPTILFFKKGTLVDKLTGLTHRAVIANKINQLLNP